MTEDVSPLLELRGVKKHFVLGNPLFGGHPQVVHAVDGVDLKVGSGEVVALVGESGCGKSTLGRSILGLVSITEGEIRFEGTRLDNLGQGARRNTRKKLQIVFQDPYSSLNPRMKVRDIIGEPIRNFGLASDADDLERRVTTLLDMVHLPTTILDRYPHEFSGGQRQRLGIARALAPDPSLIVFDEAVSALDVSVQAQILNLISELRDRLGLAMLFVSHDLAVVEHLADTVAVMYLGQVVERGARADIFGSPKHPYTKALLAAVPVPDPDKKKQGVMLHGDTPSPVNPAPGCRFRTRCPFAMDICAAAYPPLITEADGHAVACHLVSTPVPAEALK